MLRFLAIRLGLAILTLIGATLLVFGLSRLQGDPRLLYIKDGRYTQEQWEAWGKRLDLDKPLIAQYGLWLSRVVRGNMGISLRSSRPVWTMVKERAPSTLKLGLSGWIFSILFAVPMGVLSAVKRGSVLDYVARTFALLGQTAPPFWIGLMLILVFATKLQWLPTGTQGEGFAIRNFIMPTITLAWLFAAGNLRLVRSAMLDVLDSEFVKLARAKGVSGRRIVWKHAFRNALIPPLTFAGLNFAALITGSVITETVFAWPGLGRLAVNSVFTNDFPLITGVVLVFTGIYVVVTFVIDMAYGLIDPRIRYT